MKKYVGEKYGLRTVIGFAFKKKYPSGGTCNYWKFKCDCGNTGTASTQSLKSNDSCGCLQRKKAKEIGYRNRIEFGKASFNEVLNSYKQRARRKGIEFSLTVEQFRQLTSGDCFYCGVEPKQVMRPKNKRNRFGDYTYNGVDRINSNLGYIIDNCRSCCGICNKAKRDLTDEEFKEWMTRLSLYQLQSP